MQLRAKLSNSAFDPETGISTVTVKTKRGTYTGIAKVHPEDKEIQTEIETRDEENSENVEIKEKSNIIPKLKTDKETNI